MACFMYIGVIQVAEQYPIQSSLSRVRGSKNTTGMGGVKGNVVKAYEQFMHGTPLWLKTPRVSKISVRRPP